jgi:hypothetical protein
MREFELGQPGANGVGFAMIERSPLFGRWSTLEQTRRRY